MAGRALLSRIASKDGAPIDEVESILAHLRVLLNTRRGDSVTAPDFGVVDFADVVHDWPGGVQQLARSIRATILEHEPRLRSVAVRYLPEAEGLVLRFEITAQLARAHGGRTLHLSTTMRAGGRVDVSR
jgi:type VI secretion system protein